MNNEAVYRNRHTLIRFGIPTVLLAIVYFLVMGPSVNRVSEIEFLKIDRQEAVHKFKVLLKQEKLIRNDIERARQLMSGFKEQLHSSDAGEKLVRDVLAFAKEKGVSISSMEAGGVAKGEFFSEVSLKIAMEGSFAAQGAFIQRLEASKPAYVINNLSFRGSDNGVLKGQFILKALIRNENQ